MFQSTFPRGERLHKLLKNPFKSVSIHVPTRGTTLVPFIVRLSTEFQSTFPRGERHRRMWERIINAMRFNPRSHEGNDMSSSSLLRFPFVSIHVPTRGTTQNGRKDNGNIQVSIHVPTRGTTCHAPPDPQYGTRFNPRSHEGNDRFLPGNDQLPLQVSIHVPTRGTTRGGAKSFDSKIVSIHVPTRGTTSRLFRRRSISHSFNPRSHEGNDRGSLRKRKIRLRFNPRSHEGNDDLKSCRKRAISLVSIHVPTRGTTLSPWTWCDNYDVSIHVPTRGTTRMRYTKQNRKDCFNPRSHEGNDVSPQKAFQPSQSFNPRSHEGNDSIRVTGSAFSAFQSTFPRGERPRKIFALWTL